MHISKSKLSYEFVLIFPIQIEDISIFSYFLCMLRTLVLSIIYIIIYLLYPITYIIFSKHQYNFIMKISLLAI